MKVSNIKQIASFLKNLSQNQLYLQFINHIFASHVLETLIGLIPLKLNEINNKEDNNEFKNILINFIKQIMDVFIIYLLKNNFLS